MSTPADLKAHVWRKLGPKKWLVGRNEVDLLVQLAIESWRGDYMTAAGSDGERRIVCDAIATDIKRLHQAVGGYGEREYGMIWMLLLSSVISAVVQVIVKWWLERRANRTMMLIWQHEGVK